MRDELSSEPVHVARPIGPRTKGPAKKPPNQAIVIGVAVLALVLTGGLVWSVSGGGDPNTIEGAEAFCRARGIALTDKTEQKVAVCERSYSFKTPDGCSIMTLQFTSEDNKNAYLEMVEKMPFGGGGITRVHGGKIVWNISGPDAARQKIAAALRD